MVHKDGHGHLETVIRNVVVQTKQNHYIVQMSTNLLAMTTSAPSWDRAVAIP